MANTKLKSENYNSLGGINSKVSAYLNSPLEFLDIKNFDFQTPGALTQRWGSTQYVSQNFSGPITYLDEFQRLDGSSYVLVGVSGGLWSGATTGQSQGLSLTTSSATIAVFSKPIVWEMAGGCFIIASISSFQYLGFTGTQYNLGYGTTNFIPIQKNGQNTISSKVLNNMIYMADGDKFIKSDGVNAYPVGLPFPSVVGSSIVISNAAIGVTSGIQLNAFTGSISFHASYVNNSGFESQIFPVAAFSINGTGLSLTNYGGSFAYGYIDIYTPLAYGISSINIYTYCSSATLQSNRTNLYTWTPPFVYQFSVNASGSTTTRVPFGFTSVASAIGMTNQVINVGTAPDTTTLNSYVPYGGFTFSTSATFGLPIPYSFEILPRFPRYLEVYQNRMFCTGFSHSPSSVAFSDVSQPEGFRADSTFEVRSNDGDFITAIKAYGTRLYFFKKGSFFCLIGDSPSNFSLQEVSLNYGCLNNRCVVVYEQIMLFLDRKGLMIFNGASLECLSNKVQPIFDRMNYSAALDKACMIHDKLRNQILIAIPVDGATYNNLTLVYDYFNKSWTTQDGYNPTVFASIQGRNNTKNVFYGTTLGTINWFGPSFTSDNGVGFTTYFKTRFLHDLGNSTESQFRRLYLDAQVGTTYVMPINFYQDYGASVVYSTTFVLSEFQRRIDFGIPAKAIAFELAKFQTDFPLKIYGFTIESRLQRRV